jgi:drug/metabolite transporter (DMT)-like permease
VLALALALGSSLCWGTSDFLGGLQSRRRPLLPVMLTSQLAGLLGLLAIVALVAGAPPAAVKLLPAVGAGVGGIIALTAFYRALSIGTMSIVAPIGACSALVPFSLALARGERPSSLALAGAIVALCGIVVASFEERRSEVRNRKRAVVVAVGSAVGIGVFAYFLGRGGEAGSAFSTLFGARIVSLSLLVTAVILGRVPVRLSRTTLAATAVVGVGDVGANALFALAAHRGLLSIVAVLGSVYPIATVLLAHLVLGERITWTQRLGVLVAFAGIAAVSAG